MAGVFVMMVATLVFLTPAGNQASAFINDPNIRQNSNGDNPDVQAQMTHERTDQEKIKTHPGADPDFGETFTWKGSLTFSNIPTGGETAVRVIVDGTTVAPFDGAVSVSDFAWTDLQGRALDPQPTMTPESNPDGRTSFLVSGLTGSAKVSFTKQATTLQEAQTHPGKFVSANLYGAVISAPKLSLEKGKSSVSPQASCDVVTTFQMTVKGNGAWLMDAKFADLHGRGKIVLDREPLVNGHEQPEARNSITVTDSEGRDITAKLFANDRRHHAPQYQPHDASYPYFSDPLVEQAKPDIKFVDSMNWRFNPDTLTGDTWLPQGATITIKRGVKRLDCFAGAATDFDPDRQLLVSVEVARPFQPAEGSDSDSFYLPGARQTAACADIHWVQFHSTNTTQGASWGTLKLNGKDSVTVSQDGLLTGNKTPAIAISPKEPNRMYFWQDQGAKLAYYDLKTGSVVPVQTNSGKTELNTTGDSKDPISMSADPDGNLWAATRGFQPPKTAEGKGLVSLGNSAIFIYKLPYGSTDWQLEVVISHTINTNGFGDVEVKDLVMDNQGGMYLLMQKRGGGGFLGQKTKPVYLPYLSKDLIRKGTLENSESDALFTNETELKYGYDSVYGSRIGDSYGQDSYGIAYGSDGQLYIAGSLSPKRVVTSNGRPYSVVLLKKNGKNPLGGYDDLASCSFGEVSNPQPKFVVEKSAIDPVTGATLAAGKSSPNAAVIDKQGNTTVKYRVTVSNVGGSAGRPADVWDDFYAPSGFNIAGVQVEPDEGHTATRGPSGSHVHFPLPGLPRRMQLGGDGNPTSYSWEVTVKLHRSDPLPEGWQDSASCTGEKHHGFFNQVSMHDDADGSDNNHACIPFQGAQIHLYKQIVDDNGNYVSGAKFAGGGGSVTATNAGEESFFTLAATATDGTSVFSGVTSVTRSGVTGPGGITKPGTFSLSEQYSGSDSYAQTGSWDCRKADGEAVKLPTPGTITLANGDNVSCIVKNQPAVPFSIEKLAKDPVMRTDTQRVWDRRAGRYVIIKRQVAENEHIGQPATVDSNGTYLIRYRVKVTNRGSQTANSGVITDYFKVPAGLVWDDSHTFTEGADSAQPGQARITFDANNTGASVNGSGYERNVKFMSEDDLRGQCRGAATDCDLLSQSVANLPQGQSVYFDIEIPVKPDLRSNGDSEGAAKTVFDANKDNLTSCESKETEGNKYTTTAQGVANTVSIAREDRHYSPLYAEDNVACVPVKPPVLPRWRVEKAAQVDASAAAPGGVDAGWSPAGGTGSTVRAKQVDDHYQVTATYRIKVTNASDYNAEGEKVQGVPANAPEVKDTIVPPANFTVTEVRLDGQPQSIRQDASRVSFTVPAGTQKVQPGKSETHEVVVTYTSSARYQGAQLRKLSECRKSDDAFDADSGFVNTVALDGDTDGSANNQACVPVANQSYKITVKKFDAGDNALPGAKFELYLDDHDQIASEPIHNAIAADSSNSATFTSIALQPGTYWLKETKAPYSDKMSKEAAYQLLPQPLRFVITNDGKLRVYKSGTQDFASLDSRGFYLADAGTFVVHPEDRIINVHDPRAGTLPQSGSSGRFWLVLIAMLLVVLGAIGAYTTTSTASGYKIRKR